MDIVQNRPGDHHMIGWVSKILTYIRPVSSTTEKVASIIHRRFLSFPRKLFSQIFLSFHVIFWSHFSIIIFISIISVFWPTKSKSFVSKFPKTQPHFCRGFQKNFTLNNITKKCSILLVRCDIIGKCVKQKAQSLPSTN